MPVPKNYKQISITRLILNPENDRFESVENEKLALEVMLNKMGNKIYLLADDIVKRGLSAKPFYVISHDNKYLVKDGNRRTTAIKLLSRPKLIDRKKYPRLRVKFEKLHDIYIQNPIKSIVCYVFPDALTADSWVELEHTGEQKGIGTVEWESEQVHRFNKKHGKTSPIQLQAMDFIRNSIFTTDKVKEISQEISLTNFERLLNDTNIRKKLGISWIDSQLISEIEESEIYKGLSKIVYEMGKPDFSVKSIYTIKDRSRFIEQFNEDLPDTSKTTEPWILSDLSIRNDKEIADDYKDNEQEQNPSSDEMSDIISPDKQEGDKKLKGSKTRISIKRKNVIPPKLVIRITNPKVNKIYNELQKIDVQKYPNCVAIALRVFIELSIDTFLENKSLLGPGKISAAKSGKNMPEKVSIVRNYLRQKKLTDDAITKALGMMAKNEDSLLGISTFNAYVHNNRCAAIAEDLVTTWDNIQDFMLTLWSQIELE